METADVPLSRKHTKAPESVAAQRFSPLIVSSHAGGHWFESSSLHHENTLIFNKSWCFYNFLRVFKVGEKSCTTKIRQFLKKRLKKERKGEPL